MTELEKTQRAQMYIEKLANGINPLTNQPVDNIDIVNNVRISRCLFYVSDILQQVIAKEKKQSHIKERKIPFYLPIEKRANFSFSEAPIPVSEISRRINDLSDSEGMLKFKYSSITQWLIEIGMLTEVTSSGEKTVKRPTALGKNSGIILDERIGLDGAYYVVLYNTSAQHFILDNLDAILDYERSLTAMQGQPWSASYDECLVDLFQKGVPTNEIAITLKRSKSSITSRLKKLGLLSHE